MPIVVTDEGITMFVRFVFLNAFEPMDVTPLPKVTFVKGVSSKVELPIVVTLFGMIIDVRFVPEKAKFPRVSKFPGRTMDVNPVAPENACVSIFVKVVGKFIWVK